jgi:hypothetical protein
VDNEDIDVVNIWKMVEKAKDTQRSCPMRQHYAEESLFVKPFFRYTWWLQVSKAYWARRQVEYLRSG